MQPSIHLTEAPSSAPSTPPTASPSAAPSTHPTGSPSLPPTPFPTSLYQVPSMSPTRTPSAAPTKPPTTAPTATPSASPSLPPTAAPSRAPSATPSRAPSKPPTASPTWSPTLLFYTNAKFSNSLLSVVVYISTPTNCGGGQSTSCSISSLFTPETIDLLGSSTCAWDGPSCQQLTVSLTSDATLQFGDTLTYNDGVMSYEAGSFMVVFEEPTVVAEAPDSTPTPVAEISCPSSIGVCGDVKLDSSTSSGLGGRPAQYNFYINGELSSTDSSLSSLTLPGSNFEAGNTSITHVTVTPWYTDTVTSTNCSVTRQSYPTPTLSLNTLKSGGYVTASASLTAAATGCPEAGGFVLASTQFTWSSEQDLPGLGRGNSSITFAQSDLHVETDYSLSVVVVATSTLGVSVSIPGSTSFTVPSTPLSCVTGASKSISSRASLTLDGSASADFDNLDTFSYLWSLTTCKTVDGTTGACWDIRNAMKTTSPKFTLDSSLLPASSNHVFTLTLTATDSVTSFTKIASCTQSISVLNLVAPEVDISPSGAKDTATLALTTRSSASFAVFNKVIGTPIRLVGTVNTPDDSLAFLRGFLGDNSWTPVYENTWTCTTIAGGVAIDLSYPGLVISKSSNLFLNSTVLAGHPDYATVSTNGAKCTLSSTYNGVSDSVATASSSTVYFVINNGPVNGGLTVSPTSGDAFSTVFGISATGWETAYPVLKYTLGIKGSSGTILISSGKTVNEATFTIGAGTYTPFVTVSDALTGAATYSLDPIVVEEVVLTSEDLDNLVGDITADSETLANPDTALLQVQGIASYLSTAGGAAMATLSTDGVAGIVDQLLDVTVNMVELQGATLNHAQALSALKLISQSYDSMDEALQDKAQDLVTYLMDSIYEALTAEGSSFLTFGFDSSWAEELLGVLDNLLSSQYALDCERVTQTVHQAQAIYQILSVVIVDDESSPSLGLSNFNSVVARTSTAAQPDAITASPGFSFVIGQDALAAASNSSQCGNSKNSLDVSFTISDKLAQLGCTAGYTFNASSEFTLMTEKVSVNVANPLLLANSGEINTECDIQGVNDSIVITIAPQTEAFSTFRETAIVDGICIETNDQYDCVFEESDGSWSNEGCTSILNSDGNVQCSCTHLTDFALLYYSRVREMDMSVCQDSSGSIPSFIFGSATDESTAYWSITFAVAFLGVAVFGVLRLNFFEQGDRIKRMAHRMITLMASLRVLYCFLHAFFGQIVSSVSILYLKSAVGLVVYVTGFMLQTLVVLYWKQVTYFDTATASIPMADKLRTPMMVSCGCVAALALAVYIIILVVDDVDLLTTAYIWGSAWFASICVVHSSLFAFFGVKMSEALTGSGGAPTETDGGKLGNTVLAQKALVVGLGIAGLQMLSVGCWLSLIWLGDDDGVLSGITALSFLAELGVLSLFLYLYQPPQDGVLTLLRSRLHSRTTMSFTDQSPALDSGTAEAPRM